MPGTEQMLPADLVLLAMGFVEPGARRVLEAFGVERDARGNAQATTDGDGGYAHQRRRRCSPPATCGAASRWWSGRSAKAARRARGRRVPDGLAATCRARENQHPPVGL